MLNLLVSAALLSQTPQFTDSKITAVSMFKNGFAVVTRVATVPSSGEILWRNPPGGSLGTVWITANNGVKIAEVVYTRVMVPHSRPATSIEEVLATNKGKTLNFLVANLDGEKLSEIRAKLISSDGTIVIIETPSGTRVLQKSWVVSIANAEDKIIYDVKADAAHPALRIKATPGAKIYMLGLQRGMTWAPAYNFDISDPKKLVGTGKATIINDLEEFNNVEVRLITGFPNVPFINILDPLTSGATMNQVMDGMMATGGFGGGPGGAPITQNAMRRDGGRALSEGDVFAPFDPSQLAGFQAEDLFFYRQPAVSLKPGDRGYYVLFQMESEYEHIYTLDLPIGTSVSNISGSDEPLDVWHELKFKNKANLPLTTAPAITTQQGEILGQDTLKYLSPNAEGFLKITKALDVAADLDEEVTDRQRNSMSREGYNYDLLTIKGTIPIVNRKTSDIKVRINRMVSGEAMTASDGGVITKLTTVINSINNTSRVLYTIDLKPGERKVLSYTYKMYVRT